MNNPTCTINRLHFEDLSWQQFEDIVFDIVHSKYNWKELYPIGQKGGDGGVDIWGVDTNGTTWYIQCKNHKKFSRKKAEALIDEIADKHEIAKDSKLLVVVACNISLDTFQFIKSHSKEKGFKESEVWVRSNLDAMLYGDYPELLYKYMGLEKETNKNNEKVLQNSKMKAEVQKKLLCEIEWTPKIMMEIAREPFKQFRYAKLVLRSVDDIDDPHGDNASYYKISPYDLNDVGIELLDCPGVDFRIAVNTNTRCWRRIKEDEELKENEFDIRTEHVVLVPYRCIVEIREDGSDVDDYPVVICDFIFNHSPFIRDYYKHAKTKIDFKKEQPLGYSCLVQLLDEAEKNYIDDIS